MTSNGVDPDLKPVPVAAVEPLAAAVADALVGRELLCHPFYRRWEAGRLQPGELGAYAVHYRAFEAALPAVLTEVVDRLREAGNLEAAAVVEQNLADELGRPEPHLVLFDRFAAALPAGPVGTSPGPAADALVDTYLELAADGPVAALAGLAAYETQAAAIATTKADGLRRWYGLDAEATEFWDVHAEMDADHGDWTVEALALAGAGPDEVVEAARRAADGWWALLDEREAEAPDSARLCAHD
ncbi:MAG TPA: iron-containing redox enzyme family protein [Acidimicrobiales bacterium]|nr:iron-containing redox enzyme family protein [Acidimicrobiales bacterium]